MYTQVTETKFIDAMTQASPETFSYEALCALFDYYIDLEEGTGEEMELDPVAIRCDWIEYDSLADLQEAYPTLIDNLNDHTTVIPLKNGGFLCLNF